MDDENKNTKSAESAVYKKTYYYHHEDPANELARCYETSRIRVNTDFMCSLLRFAIFGAIIAIIVGAINSGVGGVVGALIALLAIVILLVWFILIMSSAKNERKLLDAEEIKELEMLDKEEE